MRQNMIDASKLDIKESIVNIRRVAKLLRAEKLPFQRNRGSRKRRRLCRRGLEKLRKFLRQ